MFILIHLQWFQHDEKNCDFLSLRLDLYLNTWCNIPYTFKVNDKALRNLNGSEFHCQPNWFQWWQESEQLLKPQLHCYWLEILEPSYFNSNIRVLILLFTCANIISECWFLLLNTCFPQCLYFFFQCYCFISKTALNTHMIHCTQKSLYLNLNMAKSENA